MSKRPHLKQAKRPVHEKRSRVFAIAGISILAIAAITLTAVAISGKQSAESTTQLISPTIAPPAEEPEPTPEPAPELEATASVVQRFLAVGETPGHLIRATAGSCPEPSGGIEVSFDGGAQWTPASTADVASTQILQIDASGAGLTRFVSLNVECQPQLSRSFVGGTDWEPDDALGAAWYLDLTDPTIVHTPSGAQSLPCSAAGLASAAERAIVLCSDASTTTTGDSGASWSAPIAVPNASAVGMVDGGFVVASVDEPECVGVRVREVSGETIGEVGQCLAAEGVAGGNTAISGRAGELFLWAGDAFARSVDGGATWQ